MLLQCPKTSWDRCVCVCASVLGRSQIVLWPACSAARTRCAVHNYQASEQRSLRHFDLTLVWRDRERDTALILTHPSPPRSGLKCPGRGEANYVVSLSILTPEVRTACRPWAQIKSLWKGRMQLFLTGAALGEVGQQKKGVLVPSRSH